MQIDDQIERLRKIATDALEQPGLVVGPGPDLEKDSIAVTAGEYLIVLKLVDKTATPPVEIMLMRGAGNPLKCLVVDSSDNILIQSRIFAMLDPLLEKDEGDAQ